MVFFFESSINKKNSRKKKSNNIYPTYFAEYLQQQELLIYISCKHMYPVFSLACYALNKIYWVLEYLLQADLANYS